MKRNRVLWILHMVRVTLIVATGLAMGSLLGWYEMPADVRKELGGY